jgi:hypothetical protein
MLIKKKAIKIYVGSNPTQDLYEGKLFPDSQITKVQLYIPIVFML